MPEYKYENIRLALLDLDLNNYRIFSATDQAEAIELMVQSEHMNLAEMGEDIVKEGISPIDIPAVVKQSNGERYTVVEGNRRLTAIRLLENPSLAKDEEVKTSFSRISKRYKPDPIVSLMCVVLEDKDAAMKWVDRKQGSGMGGAGLRRAGYVQNAKRKADKGDYEKWYAALQFLRKNDYLDAKAFPEREIDKYEIGAAIERVFGTGYLSDQLGVNISASGQVTFDNSDQDAGAALIKNILYGLVQSKPSTDTVRTVEDRERWLSRYINDSVKRVVSPTESRQSDSKTDSPVQEASISTSRNKESADDGPSEDPTKKDSHIQSRKKAVRTTLVPKHRGRGLTIDQTRIDNLYLELRKLNIKENSGQRVLAGIALRVFIDLTLTHFLIEKKIPLPKGLSGWDDRNARIPKKLEFVLKTIDPQSRNPSLDDVRKATNRDFHHSLEELNKQVHGLQARMLTQNECAEYWDRYEPLFELIFADLRDVN